MFIDAFPVSSLGNSLLGGSKFQYCNPISLYPPPSSNSLPIPKGTSSVYIPQLALTSLINKTTIIKTQTTTANLNQ
jgi:hypothetical protein